MVLQIVWFLGSFLLDATKRFAEFANKHCFCQTSRYGIRPQKLIEVCNLGFVHSKTTDGIDRQFFLTKPTIAIIFNDIVMFVTYRKRTFHRSFGDSVPIRIEFLDKPLFQAMKPLLANSMGHLEWKTYI